MAILARQRSSAWTASNAVSSCASLPNPSDPTSRNEVSRRPSPRPQPRPRHDRGADQNLGQGARHGLADRYRHPRCRPDRHPGRLLLWRLSALRRDRGAHAGDARRRRQGSQRRPGDRRLQRLPDPGRGRAAARRADAQHLAEIRLPGGEAEVENANTSFTRNYLPGQVIRAPVAHHDGNYFADPDNACPPRGRGPGGVPLRRGHQPERLDQRHRRHRQRQRQCARPDAASRKLDRKGAWRHRRPRPVRERARHAGRAAGGLSRRPGIGHNSRQILRKAAAS